MIRHSRRLWFGFFFENPGPIPHFDHNEAELRNADVFFFKDCPGRGVNAKHALNVAEQMRWENKLTA